MYEPNVEPVLQAITPASIVLDIGGWARPFNRANWVVDAEPWGTRGYYGATQPAQGGSREWFSERTWIQRDVCDRAPLPFADKAFDFVICSHVLEDVRDPLGLCAEIVRVGRAGYIELPSRAVESCRGIEPGLVGWSHHRWLVDITGTHLTFMMKYHTIHAHWRYSFPARYLRSLPHERHVQWLFWTDDFTCEERTLHGPGTIADALSSYVATRRPYPPLLVTADRLVRTAFGLPGRLVRAIQRRIGD
ncbi:MAG: methyltransferase domain-containing protein [Gemmatimonadales bacterium]